MNGLDFIVNASLIIMIALLPFAFYRVIRPQPGTTDEMKDAPNRLKKASNRLVAVDLITNLLVGIVVVLAIVENNDTTIDIGIVLAALSFAATVSIARFISEGRVF